METRLNSDFAAARVHLDRALHYLRGSDAVSRDSCMTIDLLLEAVITAEFQKKPAKVLEFRNPRASAPSALPNTKGQR
jgi:hypothetical protein